MGSTDNRIPAEVAITVPSWAFILICWFYAGTFIDGIKAGYLGTRFVGVWTILGSTDNLIPAHVAICLPSC